MKATRKRPTHCAKTAPKTAPATPQKTFHEQLPDEPPSRCTERKPHGDLASTDAGARQQQNSDIGAGNQQDQGGDGQQHPQGCLVEPAQIRESRSCRKCAELVPQVVLLRLRIVLWGCGRFQDARRKRCHFGVGLRDSHAGLQTSHGGEPIAIAQVGQGQFAVYKRLRAQWHGHVELMSNVNARETRWGDADDFKRMAFE
jgi:hypothetical protein